MVRSNKSFTPKTAEERSQEVKALTEDFTLEIERYFESEESIKEHLRFMSQFHNYSVRNSTLINKQFPGATAIGSFHFWKEKSVMINKGEKGIKIFVPTPIQYFKRDGKEIQIKLATEQEKALIKQNKIDVKTKMFFKIGHVFDYTQTNAKERGFTVSEIFGRYYNETKSIIPDGLEEALVKLAAKLSFKIVAPAHELGTAKGYANALAKEIGLNPRNTTAENVTTLIHELVHAKLHPLERRAELTRPEREFQAEMVSFVVANRYNIDTKDFSLSYLANWTSNNQRLKDKENLLNEVRITASEFIEYIDERLLEKQREKQKEREMEKDNDFTIATKQKDNKKIVVYEYER